MAATSFGTNDPLAVKLWSKKLSVEALKQTWASKFMGDGTDAIIQIKDETKKSAGDQITFGLRVQLTSAGIVGDGTLQGNEEALATYSDSVTINQLRTAVRNGGRMTAQRVPFDLRQEALSGLRDWWAGRIDLCSFNQLCGNTVQTDTRYTGLNATVAPDSGHILRVNSNEASAASISTTSTFTLTLLDQAVERARSFDPNVVSNTTTDGVQSGYPLRPCNINGSEYYVAVLHPAQITSLRALSSSAGNWFDIQSSALKGGEIEDNPIFTGALGMYNNCVLHGDARIQLACDTTTAKSNARRAVFLGAQAAVIGFGRDNGPERFTWVEELFDYENQLGVSAGTIFGMVKTTFNSTDFGVIALETYAKPV